MNAETQATLAHYYQTFADALRARIRFILHDAELTEDVLQEVFVKACCKWETLASHAHPYGWLYRVATTTAIDAARHRKRFASPLVPLADDDGYPDPSNHDPQETALAREHLRECLQATRAGERALLVQEALYGNVERTVLYAARRRLAQRGGKAVRKQKKARGAL